MEHLAILSKKRKLLQKIIAGEKTIESRWYKFKRTPYEKISSDDVIYFKESGDKVEARAEVEKVLFFDCLDSEKISHILKKYGKKIGINDYDPEKYRGINFCILIFLKNVKVIKPFDIDKSGYGLMCAWITVDDINKIKKTEKKTKNKQ